ncbi:MAG: ABC transporter ATP-binding protein [Actinomycetota bacterium]|nr:ABC transporter ATP-binding protein [Actinomycetota bacterium]
MMMPQQAALRALRSGGRGPNGERTKVQRGTLKRAMGLARPYRWMLAGFLALVLGGALAGAAIPFIFRAVIDRGIGPRPPYTAHPGLILALAGLLAGLAVVTAALSLWQRYLSARVGEGLIYELRTRLFTHAQTMPLAFFTQSQTGALVSRIESDVLGAQQAFTTVLSNVVGSGLTVLITLGAMMALSWQITLLCLAVLPVLAVLARLVGRSLQRITRESYNLNAGMSTMVTERFNASGAMLVKLFGSPAAEEGTFADKAGRVRDIGVKSALVTQGFLASLTLVASLATALVYGMGGRMAAAGVLSVGTIVALSSYLNRLFAPLTLLSSAPVTVMNALVSFERIFEVLDLPGQPDGDIAGDDLPEALLGGAPLTVEMRDVGFRYPSPRESSLASLAPNAPLGAESAEPVLRGVSFKVEPGQMAALVGPSGAGKTTICSLIPRLYDVTEGVVMVGGCDVTRLPLSVLRGSIGMVTQDPHLYHDTVRANLLYGRPEAAEEELWAVLEAAQLADVVGALPERLDTVVGDRGYRLSGGEKQRLAIARVLLKEPAVILLDEATSHLDSESELAVQRALETMLSGRTSLVIAHRLSTVLEADVILVVEHGRIVERGRHDELVSAGGLYAELYRTQFQRQDAALGAD